MARWTLIRQSMQTSKRLKAQFIDRLTVCFDSLDRVWKSPQVPAWLGTLYDLLPHPFQRAHSCDERMPAFSSRADVCQTDLAAHGRGGKCLDCGDDVLSSYAVGRLPLRPPQQFTERAQSVAASPDLDDRSNDSVARGCANRLDSAFGGQSGMVIGIDDGDGDWRAVCYFVGHRPVDSTMVCARSATRQSLYFIRVQQCR